MTRVALVWHMHQPFYEDPATGEHVLPWVRLHALRDYYGMVALLGEFPDVRVTFNLVPSLLVQIEAFASDTARDPHLEIGLKPADTLTPADVLFALQNFFHAHRPRMIDPFPRYAELLERRGPTAPQEPADALARGFTVDDLRDLQVWHKLVWIDASRHERDERIRSLVARGRRFLESDKAVLREVELELLRAVVPAYREAAGRGQVELSASPFYHPILPLLCDTDVYRHARPGAPLPGRRFHHPEDALEQLVRARMYFGGQFGRPPQGLWPSEGAVSNAVVPLAVEAGFSWMATDEGILGRTVGTAFARDGDGQLEQPELLYRPYGVRVGEARIACAFRDRVLSDLVGFTYATWGAEDAARDLIGRIIEGGRRYSERTGGEDALVTIILDGENAWERYEDSGRPFLRALYSGLSAHPDIATVTMAQACAGPNAELDGIFPGSWIDADFYVWIGHEDDRRAWDQLAEAREVLQEAAAGMAADAHAQAAEELLVAEGSDWFWWYGDDRSSDHDRDFDDLFRRHLRNVYSLAGRAVPDALFLTNITTEPSAAGALAPLALLTPRVDGEETSYFEWLGAGRFEAPDVSGTMHESARRRKAVRLILFAFDRQAIHVRVEGPEPMREVLDGGAVITLEFLTPPGVRAAFERSGAAARGTLLERRPEGNWEPAGRSLRTAAGRVLEASIPLEVLGGLHGDRPDAARAGRPRLRFFVTVRDEAGRELERHPGSQPIVVEVPDEAFAARHWRV
jgi:alpha-amylase/alpha-mannosidase (GH57 family)